MFIEFSSDTYNLSFMNIDLKFDFRMVHLNAHISIVSELTPNEVFQCMSFIVFEGPSWLRFPVRKHKVCSKACKYLLFLESHTRDDPK